jgi:hypothetical protein
MGIFDTTANTGFNAFNDPMNSYNQNPGQWGMNANYLTPSFDAPYRPPYSGGNGSSPAYPNPSFFRGLFGLSPANIFTSNYGVGTHRQDDLYATGVSDRMMDAPFSFAQRIGAPLAAFAGMYGIGRAWQTANQSRAAGAAMSGWGAMWGMPRSVQRSWRSAVNPANVSVFTAMGQRAGMGAAKGMLGGASMFMPGIASSGFARGAIGAAGMLGGIAGSIAFPAAIAQGALATADNMVFDQFTGLRENQNLLREAFKGVTFAEGDAGDPFTGQGLSRRSAAKHATEITKMGAKDQLFNARDMATMTSMSAQMGLLDNVNADQISSRMASIIKQLRIVMSVAGTTDFKEAINMMAKLQMAGVQSNSIAGVMSGIGGLSSAAGISTSRMMNTVGAQGQYLFQANGLTPYIGQMAAAQSMAGFSSAFRSGLISPDMMARMGGVEGATQLSVTGQVNAAQTTYNMMRGFNQYTSGRGGSGVVGNVMNFGSTFAGNPLAAYGAMMRTRGYNIGKQFEDRGPMAVHDQLMDLAKVNPITMNKGRIDQDEAFTLLMQMGMSSEQAQAYLAQMGSAADPRSRKQMLAGLRSNELSTTRDWLEQTGQTKFTAMLSPLTKTFRAAKEGIAESLGGVVRGVGNATDRALAWWTGTTVGSPDDIGSQRVSDIRNSGEFSLVDLDKGIVGSKEDMAIRRFGKKKRSFSDEFQTINTLAQSGDEDAIAILRSGASHKDMSNALYNLSERKKIGSEFKTQGSSEELMKALSQSSRSERKDIEADKVNMSISKTAGLAGEGLGDIFKDDTNILQRQETYEATQRIMEARQKGNLSSAEKDQLERDMQLLGKNTNIDPSMRNQLEPGIKKIMQYADQNRIDTMGGVSNAGGAEALLDRAKTEEGRSKIFQKDSKYLGKYMNAQTDKERAEAIYSARLESGDILLQTPGGVFDNAQSTEDQNLEFRKKSQALRKQEQTINKMAQEGKIDFKSAYDMTAGIQLNQAALTFSQAVNLFGEKVSLIGAKQVTPMGLPNGLPPAWNVPKTNSPKEGPH